MKTFNVYKHSVLGYEAVKQGWSWPAFFFGVLWSLFKKLWMNAVMFFIMAVILFYIEGISIAEGDSGGVVLVNVLFVALYVCWGVNGNKWRREALSKQGYEFIKSVQTPTPEAAIGAVVTGKDDQAMAES